MRCISPLKASHNMAGDVVYSSRKAVSDLVGFQFECRKCLPCRLNVAREKAVRAYHEAQMHRGNIFLTLTYDDASLTSSRLNYGHYQLFMKSLLESRTRGITDKDLRISLRIPYMVTGEYGDRTKRPHWHAIIFNYYPDDARFSYTSDSQNKVYTSEKLTRLWGRGKTEFGSVTLDSAGYVARYAAKKLAHGRDEDHDFHPIHKTSSKHALGKAWIKKYAVQTFKRGFVVLPDGTPTKIPRYYVDWCKKHNPSLYNHYVTQVQPKIISLAEEKQKRQEAEYLAEALTYKGGRAYPMTRSKVEETILKTKFKRLQEMLKL